MTRQSNPKSPKILVLGSINMDLVVRTATLPAPGETLLGHELKQIPGGKGANQAVAAARLGARVAMVGRVGNDGFAARLTDELGANDVDTDRVAATDNYSSGVAVISVDDEGQNCITVIPGANAQLSCTDVRTHQSAFDEIDLLMLQLEVPLETVMGAIELARSRSIPVLLDPAPAPGEFPPELLQVDFLCPNETEAGALSGIPVNDVNGAKEAAKILHARGASHVIITMGNQGAVMCDQTGKCYHSPGFSVDAIDSTAAGDAFAAAFAIGIAEGSTFQDAVRFGCAAGAVATGRVGAQPAMPIRNDITTLMSVAQT